MDALEELANSRFFVEATGCCIGWGSGDVGGEGAAPVDKHVRFGRMQGSWDGSLALTSLDGCWSCCEEGRESSVVGGEGVALAPRGRLSPPFTRHSNAVTLTPGFELALCHG